MTAKQFIIKYDELPPSVNDYLKTAVRRAGNKHIPYVYETKSSKDFKKRFRAYLQREVRKQGWNKAVTSSDNHWYLDCIFYQARTNQDNNNYYKILCDSLTGIVIEDDKNILVRTQRVFYDSKNPRFMAVLRPVGYQGIFNDETDYTLFVENNCKNCKRFKKNCSILRKALEGRVQEEIDINNSIKICKKKR